MPYWLWIGRDSQLNPDPSHNFGYNHTAPGNSGAGGGDRTFNGLNGKYVQGNEQMEMVDVNGQILGGSYQTTYNPTYGNIAGPGGTQMHYTSPQTDAFVADTRITGLLRVQSKITVWDDAQNSEVELPGTYTLIFMQMSNGDMFVRPHPDDAGPTGVWAGISKLYGIEIVSAKTITSSTAVNSVVGFDPSIIFFDIVCFARGTRILCQRGEVAVEDLQAGDLVMTRDAGLQPLRWIGSKKLSRGVLAVFPALRPIEIAAGALGGGMPVRALRVSAQHRILVRSAIAGRMFGAGEVLVAACHLLDLPGIRRCDAEAGVEYFHLLFDRHQVIFADGAEAESLYTGPQALRAIDEAARAELLLLFPGLLSGAPAPARVLVPGRRARQLAGRHLRNRQPLSMEAGIDSGHLACLTPALPESFPARLPAAAGA